MRPGWGDTLERARIFFWRKETADLRANVAKFRSDRSVHYSMTKSKILLFYGLAIYGSGLSRYFFFPGGENGLWFGLVMGSLALLGGVCFAKGKVRAGGVLGSLAILFTGGWYAWECFVIKGFAQAEWRQLTMILVSIVVATFLIKKSEEK